MSEQTADRIPPEMADETHYFRPPHGWTCFHCGETFMAVALARDHFGADPLKDPACRIKVGEERGLVAALRRAEAELERYRCDDSDADRAMAAMRSDHAQALIREEEKGYARGVADARQEMVAEIWPAKLTEPLADIRRPWAPLKYEADGALNSARDWRDWAPADATPGRYRHARFMPRWASRFTLIIESVKVERLQDITEADALAEGALLEYGEGASISERRAFELIWKLLHGEDAWTANPWVAAITFRAIRANIDTLDANGCPLVCEERAPCAAPSQ